MRNQRYDNKGTFTHYPYYLYEQFVLIYSFYKMRNTYSAESFLTDRF